MFVHYRMCYDVHGNHHVVEAVLMHAVTGSVRNVIDWPEVDGIPYNRLGTDYLGKGPFEEWVYEPGWLMRLFGSTLERRLDTAYQRVEARAKRVVAKGRAQYARYEAMRSHPQMR